MTINWAIVAFTTYFYFGTQLKKMLLYPHDIKLIGMCVVIPTIFEVLRLIIAYFVAAPPKKVKELEQQRMEAKIKIASIKSVQVELVRHSKLQREVIKIDKELETLQANQQPKFDKLKKIMHIARVSLIVFTNDHVIEVQL